MKSLVLPASGAKLEFHEGANAWHLAGYDSDDIVPWRPVDDEAFLAGIQLSADNGALIWVVFGALPDPTSVEVLFGQEAGVVHQLGSVVWASEFCGSRVDTSILIGSKQHRIPVRRMHHRDRT